MYSSFYRVPRVGDQVLFFVGENAPPELLTNGVKVGDALPATINRVWSPESTGSACNLAVFPDMGGVVNLGSINQAAIEMRCEDNGAPDNSELKGQGVFILTSN